MKVEFFTFCSASICRAKGILFAKCVLFTLSILTQYPKKKKKLVFSHRNEKAFDNETISGKNIYKCYKDFREDQERPATEPTSFKDIKDLMFKSRRLTNRAMADALANIWTFERHFKKCFMPRIRQITIDSKNRQFIKKIWYPWNSRLCLLGAIIRLI